MGDTIIRVDRLGKRYRIGHVRGPRTLREDLVDLVRAPFRRARIKLPQEHFADPERQPDGNRDAEGVP